MDEQGVCFRTKGGKSITLAPQEFIRRWFLHVLPPNFVKIRHYGLWAGGRAPELLEKARELLEAERPPPPAPVPPSAPQLDAVDDESDFRLGHPGGSAALARRGVCALWADLALRPVAGPQSFGSHPPRGALFGSLRFDDQLRPMHLALALTAQQEADQGAEYSLPAPGVYLRYYREPDRLLPVTDAERAMLDGCVATFSELAAQYGELLRQPLPPRYRLAGRRGPDLDN